MITEERKRAIKAFENDFKLACEKYDIDAAFILIKEHSNVGSLLMVGGVTEVSDYVEACLSLHSVEARGSLQ